MPPIVDPATAPASLAGLANAAYYGPAAAVGAGEAARRAYRYFNPQTNTQVRSTYPRRNRAQTKRKQKMPYGRRRNYRAPKWKTQRKTPEKKQARYGWDNVTLEQNPAVVPSELPPGLVNRTLIACALQRGTSDQERIGDKINITSFGGWLTLETNSENPVPATVRVIAFTSRRAVKVDPETPISGALMRNGPFTVNWLYNNYDPTTNIVHFDQVVQLVPGQDKDRVTIPIRRSFRRGIQQVYNGPDHGSLEDNAMYIAVMSDVDAQSDQPTVTGTITFYYYDV
jgi:hypothetical protein